MAWSSRQQGFWSVPFRGLPSPSPLLVQLLLVSLQIYALKHGLSTKPLLDAEVSAKVSQVTEEEVESLFRQHKAKCRRPEKAIRERIREDNSFCSR